MIFHVAQEKFEGPLELLAELIEKEKLAISEISLARVADEYLELVRSMEAPDPEELAGFLVIAAQLMLVKSRSLLPGFASTDEDEVSLGELEARLKEYQRFRELGGRIRELEARGLRIIAREGYLMMEPVFYPPQGLAPGVLDSVFRSFLAALPRAGVLAEEKVRRIVSLEEKIAHIRSVVENALERGFSELIRGSKEKVDIIVSFLALLELVRQKFLDVSQEELFSDIVIKKLP